MPKPTARTASNPQRLPRLMRFPEVMELTGLTRSGIYFLIGRGQFPKPIKLGGHSVAFIEPEIAEWIEHKRAIRDDG